MQIWVTDKRNAIFSVKTVGINATTLYDLELTWAVCLTAILKDLSLLRNIPALTIHCMVDHGLCPLSLVCCEALLCKTQFMEVFIVWQNLQKEIVNGPDM